MLAFLKEYYGPYEYFGGDGVFYPAKTAIINEIAETITEVSEFQIRTLLETNLSFIKDAHFNINDSTSFQNSKKSRTFYSKDILFRLEDDKYIELESKKEIVSFDIDGESYSARDLIKPVLLEDATLTYQVVYVGDEIKNIQMHYCDEKIKEVNLTEYVLAGLTTTPAFRHDTINETDIIIPGVFEQSNVVFANTGALVKESPNIILDLRDNPGGDVLLVSEWMNGYKGEKYSHAIQIHRYNDIFPISKEEYMSKYSSTDYFELDDSQLITMPKEGQIESDALVIVLMNSYTASASERLIDALSFYENVIFVGGNSSGMWISNQMYPYESSKYGYTIEFGNSLNLLDSSYFEEYKGFVPDIYYFGYVNLEEVVLQYFDLK